MLTLSNKLEKLKSRTSATKPDIVTVAEVYSKSGDPNTELKICTMIHNCT